MRRRGRPTGRPRIESAAGVSGAAADDTPARVPRNVRQLQQSSVLSFSLMKQKGQVATSSLRIALL